MAKVSQFDFMLPRAERTAISRNKPSAPLKKLLSMSKLHRGMKVLDYGCGRGDDGQYLKELGLDVWNYDTYYQPSRAPLRHRYDAILITYVFCVLDKPTRDAILDKATRLLRKGGKIYVSVRRDIKKDYISRIGTHQFAVHLDYPIVAENSSFCIYEV